MTPGRIMASITYLAQILHGITFMANIFQTFTRAKASADSKILTATRFNLVKNAIGSMNATGISNVSKGDPVLGSYFITLANKANGVTK